MKRPREGDSPLTWSMSGDPCPSCGGFDTLVENYEGLKIHSLKPGSRYRHDCVIASPYTVLACRECGHREERRGFPDGETLRARGRTARRKDGPSPPRRRG
jgi:hypothetical protein